MLSVTLVTPAEGKLPEQPHTTSQAMMRSVSVVVLLDDNYT